MLVPEEKLKINARELLKLKDNLTDSQSFEDSTLENTRDNLLRELESLNRLTISKINDRKQLGNCFRENTIG